MNHVLCVEETKVKLLFPLKKDYCLQHKSGLRKMKKKIIPFRFIKFKFCSDESLVLNFNRITLTNQQIKFPITKEKNETVQPPSDFS